jgi:hypothetical protein
MFEKYQKAARDIPNKKEREEIEILPTKFRFIWQSVSEKKIL